MRIWRGTAVQHGESFLLLGGRTDGDINLQVSLDTDHSHDLHCTPFAPPKKLYPIKILNLFELKR
jgi:hypothetical protein